MTICIQSMHRIAHLADHLSVDHFPALHIHRNHSSVGGSANRLEPIVVCKQQTSTCGTLMNHPISDFSCGQCRPLSHTSPVSIEAKSQSSFHLGEDGRNMAWKEKRLEAFTYLLVWNILQHHRQESLLSDFLGFPLCARPFWIYLDKCLDCFELYVILSWTFLSFGKMF